MLKPEISFSIVYFAYILASLGCASDKNDKHSLELTADEGERDDRTKLQNDAHKAKDLGGEARRQKEADHLRQDRKRSRPDR